MIDLKRMSAPGVSIKHADPCCSKHVAAALPQATWSPVSSGLLSEWRTFILYQIFSGSLWILHWADAGDSVSYELRPALLAAEAAYAFGPSIGGWF